MYAPLNQVLTLKNSKTIKDSLGGSSKYEEATTSLFAGIVVKKTGIQAEEIEGKAVSNTGLDVTIRAENLSRLRKAKQIFYKETELFFENIPSFIPIKEKYITLNAKFQSSIQYK